MISSHSELTCQTAAPSLSVREKPVKVLLVEDNTIAQKYTLMLLENLDCVVDIAKTGQEAIDMATQIKPYDLIFMDIGLPDMNGIDVAKQIKESLARPVKIIALTAHSKRPELGSDLDVVMDDFIQKPASSQNFASIIAGLSPENSKE